MRITEAQLRNLTRETLARQSDLNDQQLERLSQLIDDADTHPEFAGYDLVKGPERDAIRLAVLDDEGEPVGFMTPRWDRGYWRTGAIYADPSRRVPGLMRSAIIEFFSDPEHRPARVWIADDNLRSQRAFTGAGFNRGARRDIGDAPTDKGHDYYLD
jgi:hypothetical protein